MRTQLHCLALVTAFSIACLSSRPAWGEDSAAAARAALADLDVWLGSGANAEAWSKYLDLPALRAQLDRGNEADREVIDQVRQQLHSGAKGLELARFVRLRDALERWNEELAIVQAPSLSEAVLAAEAEFRPISDADLAASKAALAAAMNKLDRYLTGANGAAWKQYLQWQDLEAQLASDAPSVEVLAGIYQKFTADQVGLEMPLFADVADALARYIYDLEGQADDLGERFAEQLKALAEALAQYSDDPLGDTAHVIGGHLGWLERMRQSPALVRAVRARYSQPNLYLAASERLVGAGIEQPLDEVTPVRDVILGTDIHGTGRMIGHVSVELVPSERGAMLDTMLRANVSSRTVGYNGPATIHSNGLTAIAGRKRIVIDETGFTSYPATAAANTRTRVTGIGGSGLVQRVASKRVGEQKPQAERIAADRAAARARLRMEQQVTEQLRETNANYQTKVRNPLLRRREFPSLRFRTTTDDLFLTAQAANRNQIAAPAPPPDVEAENDLAVQIHESAINNLAAALVGGLTLTEEELQERVIELRGSLPEALESDEDRDPWSITFAREQPVTVQFSDGGVQITIRGQRYTSGDQDFRAMNVTAEYRIEIGEPDEQGIHPIQLTRTADLRIVPPGPPRRLSAREITLRTLLERRFGRLFEPEVQYTGLVLPGRWRQAGILDPKQLQSGGGWMVVALLESGVPAPPEEEQDEPKTDRVTRAAR